MHSCAQLCDGLFKLRHWRDAKVCSGTIQPLNHDPSGVAMAAVVTDCRNLARVRAMRSRFASRPAGNVRQQIEQSGAVRLERTRRPHCWAHGCGAVGSGSPLRRARRRLMRAALVTRG